MDPPRGGQRSSSPPSTVFLFPVLLRAAVAARLDPPLTTMALPYRDMGRRAGDMLSGKRPLPATVEEVPFRLVERASI